MPRPSRDYLPLLEHICDEFLASGCELSPYDLPKGLRHNVTTLQLLDYVRNDNDRIVPTRNGMRRAGRVEPLARVAELMRQLQGTSESDRTGENWNEEMVAKLTGWDEKTVSLAMMLLHGAPGVHTLFLLGDGGLCLYLGHGFGDADAARIAAPEPELAAVRWDHGLLMWYGEGQRVFPEVFITRGDLEGACLEDISIDGGKLEDSNLFGCNFKRSKLGAYPAVRGRGYYGLSLAGSDLGRAELQGADLRGANLDGARIEGARLDRHTLLPADARAAAVWQVLYVDDQPRRREDPWDAIEPAPDEGYRMVHDRGSDKWEVHHRGMTTVIPDTIGARIVAVLLANPGREIHALDVEGEVDRVPFVARALIELPLESADAEELMRRHRLPNLIDLRPTELQRLRACLRACERLGTEGGAPNLLDDLRQQLRKHQLPLGELARARMATDRLRVAFTRLRSGDLGGKAFAPLAQAIKVAELCSYTPPEQ